MTPDSRRRAERSGRRHTRSSRHDGPAAPMAIVDGSGEYTGTNGQHPGRGVLNVGR